LAIIIGDSCIGDPALDELDGLDAEGLFKPIRLDESRQPDAPPAGDAPAGRFAAVLTAINLPAYWPIRHSGLSDADLR
jgi:hypothetical protein